MITTNNEKYNSVDWVRKIRDENYEKYKDLKLSEFAEKLIEEVKDTDIWKKFKE